MNACCRLLVIVSLAVSQQPLTLEQISHSGRGAYEVSLVIANAQRAVAWYDTRDGHAELYLRRLDANGHPTGEEKRLTHGVEFAYEPELTAAADGGFALAWYDKHPRTGWMRAQLARVNADGTIAWQTIVSSPNASGRNAVAHAVGDDVFVAWIETRPSERPEVWTAWYDASGHLLVPARRLAPASWTTWNLNVATDGRSRVWLAFNADVETRASEIFLAAIDKNTSVVTRLTDDDGAASTYPELAFRGTRAALTWSDERDGNQEVYLAVGEIAELRDGLAARARRITTTPGASIGAAVTWNGDIVGLTWCDNSLGQHETYVETLDAAGVPLQPPLRVTDTPADSLIPSIQPWRSGFALAWNEFRAGPGGGHGDDGRSEVFLTTTAR